MVTVLSQRDIGPEMTAAGQIRQLYFDWLEEWFYHAKRWKFVKYQDPEDREE
jgi:hypothetical protein